MPRLFYWRRYVEVLQTGAIKLNNDPQFKSLIEISGVRRTEYYRAPSQSS